MLRRHLLHLGETIHVRGDQRLEGEKGRPLQVFEEELEGEPPVLVVDPVGLQPIAAAWLGITGAP